MVRSSRAIMSRAREEGRRLAAGAWRRLAGPLQWRLLWLANAKFIVGVAGVISDSEGRVLLLRHRFWPDESWGIPGGYVHKGERLADALARELREETGCQIDDVRLLEVSSGYRMRIEVFFAARLTGGELRLDPAEVLEAGFFSPDALPAGVLATHRRLIQRALRDPA